MQFDHAAAAPIGGHLGGPIEYRPDINSHHQHQQSRTAGSSSATGSTETADRMGSMGTMKAGDVFPDLHHNMSKKIAQLTKVIYHLNTKNEDRQFELDEVNTNHQKEMKDILSDAANKIKAFKDQLTSKQGQLNAQAQLEKLRQVHAKEKKEALAEFRVFKRNAREKEEGMQLDCKERLSELAAQLVKQKASFEGSLEKFQEKGKALRTALDTARTSASANLSALKERHQMELEEIVRKGNEKFNTMMMEQLMAQEETRRAAEVDAKGAKLTFEEGVGRLRAELAAEKEGALSALRRESENELQAVRRSLSEKIKRARAEVERAQAAFEDEKRQRDALRADRDRLKDEITKIRENATSMLETARLEEASLRRLLKTAAAEGRRLVKALGEAEAARDDALAAGKGVGGQANELRQQLERTRDEKEGFERATTAEIASKDGEIAACLGEIESLRQKLEGEMAHGQAERAKLDQDLSGTREALRSASRKAAEFEERVRISQEEVHHAKREEKRSVEELLRQLEATKKQAATQEANLRATMERELLEMSEAATKVKSEAEKEVEETKKASAGGARAQSERAKKREEELMGRLKEEKIRFEAVLEEERDARAREAREAATAMKSLRQEAARERGRLERLLEDVRREAEAVEAKLEGSSRSLGEELQSTRTAFYQEKESSESLREEASRLAKAMELVQAELQGVRKAAVERAEEERAVANAEAREIEDRASREIAERLRLAATDAAGALAAEVDRVSKELKLEHEGALQAAIARERESIETRDALVLQQTQASSKEKELRDEAERRALMEAHTKRLQEIESKHGAELSSMRSEAQEKENASVERLRGELQAQAARGARGLEATRVAALREKKAAVASAVASKTVELTTAADRATAALTANLEGERDAVRATLNQTEEALCEKEQTLGRLTEELAAARTETEAVTQAGDFQSRRKQAAAEAREAALVSKHAVELSHAVGRQREELRGAETRFREKEKELSSRVDALQEDQRRLELRYENRPSRPEDVARIRHLETEAVEKEGLVSRVKEEMAFLKRELLNREENYNKKFNANPVVGVMQVVKPKGMRGGSGDASRGSSDSHASHPRPPGSMKKTFRSASLPGYGQR